MKIRITLSAIFAALFAALIWAVKTVDVAPIGPAGTSIGLSTINKAVHDALGTNVFWHEAINLLGIAAIASGSVFAVMGLVQLIKRRSLIKVDSEILTTGVLYVTIGVLYAVFEKIIINYRPILEEGQTFPEAAFPSSHTVLAIVVMGSIFILVGKYVADRKKVRDIKAICALVIAISVVGRLISGVHWFTDILGGMLISAALLCAYSAALRKQGMFKNDDETGLTKDVIQDRIK